MFLFFMIIIVLLIDEVLGAREVHFVALFYIDIFLITVLTLCVLYFR
jgi:hypothetical protein